MAQSPAERVASFLHAVKSTPVAELREALARSAAQAKIGDLPRVALALAEVDGIARQQELLPVLRQVEDAARRAMDPLLTHANRRPDELPARDATALQLLVEWCAVGLLVVEDLSEESFRALWGPFAPIVARRLQDTRQVTDEPT